MGEQVEISEAEFEVMQVIWNRHPVTANEIVAELSNTDWNDKTIRTLINRLQKKRVIGYEKQGRAFVFSPLIAKQDYLDKASDSFISRMFDGRVSTLLAQFVAEKKLSDDEIKAIKKMIEEMEDE